MDEKTLIISCVEYYGFLKNTPGNSIYKFFEESGLLATLRESLVTLPEMDLDFYIGMIDGIIALEQDAGINNYGHYAERTRLICQVTELLEKKYYLDPVSACKTYYHSETAGLVAEDPTGYYKKTPEEIAEMISL